MTRNTQGEEADPGCLSGIISRFKAKVKPRPVDPVPRPENMNTASPGHCAAGSTQSTSNSTALAAPADDETLQSSDTAVTSRPSPGSRDPAPSSSTAVATDTGDKPPSDSLADLSEENKLWMEAYKAANPETKKWVDGLSKRTGLSNSSDSVRMEDLIGVVRNLEKRHQEHALRIRVGDKNLLWRDYAPRIISSIKAIGDVAIQFAPAPSGIIWSALKTVLQMSLAPGEELAAVLGCSEKVLSIKRRGGVYEAIYTNANTRSDLLEDLTNRLIGVYTKSLDVLAHIGQRPPGGYQQVLHSIVNPGEAKDLIASLIQCENELVMTAQACEAARSADVDKRFNAMLGSLNEPLMQINDRVCDILEEAEEREIIDALEYLSHINHGEQHRTRADSRTPGTGEWLLQHTKFQEWEQVPASTILWLQGTVGMGKSFLASKVVDRFRPKPDASHNHESTDASKDDKGLAFFYCSRAQNDLQDPLLTLQSFVRQLSTSPRHSKRMKTSLIKLYRENRKNGSKLGFDACKEQLLESVNLYPQTIIILDGLDECDVGLRGRLITILANLVKDAQHPLKIFISSRREQDIVKLLPAESVIEIDANDNRDDIQKFVEEKMEEMEKIGLWESIPETLKSDIKTTLCNGSDGMFRWAYFQMEQLSKCQQAKDIRDRLGKLPMSLNASYHELFAGMSSYGQETLRRAVMWVICAYKPLSSKQLLAAVRLSISDDGGTLDVEEELTEETLRSICHHLVVTDSQKDEWKFPHASVIEYFEAEHKWTIAKAHSFVAKHSLLCLIDGYSNWDPSTNLKDDKDDEAKGLDNPEAQIIEESTSNKEDPLHPVGYLHEYLRRYWFRHVNALEGLQPYDVQLSRLVKHFMGFNGSLPQSCKQYRCWFEHLVPDRYSLNLDDLSPLTNPIFGACTFGFYHILKDWWSAGVDISQVNEMGLDLLSIAAKNGHQHLCEKLIGLGADVNTILRSGRTSALCKAIEKNDIDMVKFLLDNKADPNIPLEDTILCQSITHPLAITRVLLDAGANPNTQCDKCKFGSSLERIGYHEDYEAAALLIQYKANVNFYPTRGQFGSPLAAAAYGGSIKLLRLLIEHGADVNAPLKYGEYGSALVAGGVGWGNVVSVVKFLIEEAGADPNILSTNPPSRRPWSHDAVGYQSGRYLKEKGYVMDEDILRKVGLWPRSVIDTPRYMAHKYMH